MTDETCSMCSRPLVDTSHTLEQDFQHFMGYTNYPREIEDKLRHAYEHGAIRGNRRGTA